jgi:ferredoxin-NADP reductase
VQRTPDQIPLVVSRLTRESARILSIDLSAPDGAELPPWEPGAHIDVQLITRHQRQYSLCGDPRDRRTYRIAVLREDLSRGASMYIHDFLRVGSPVRARAPRNLFPLVPADEHLLLAAGIGITPLLPMAHRLHDAGTPWSLRYAVRHAADVPFARELAELGPVVSIHASDRDGRLDLGALLTDVRPGTAVYACGPSRFLAAVDDAMTTWPPGALHLERFEPKVMLTRPNTPFTVRTARNGITVEVPADRSMLQALTGRDLPIGGSCHRGVCGTCAVRVVEGGVEHRDSLTTDPASRVMYPCVSRATSSEIVIDL